MSYIPSDANEIKNAVYFEDLISMSYSLCLMSNPGVKVKWFY